MLQLRSCQNLLTNYRNEYWWRIATFPSERERLVQGWQGLLAHGRSLAIINETLANVLDAAELCMHISEGNTRVDVSLEAISYLDGKVQISSVTALVRSVAVLYHLSDNILPQLGENYCISKVLKMLPGQHHKLIPSVEGIVDRDVGLSPLIRPIGWKSVHDRFIRGLGSWCEIGVLQQLLIEKFRFVVSFGWLRYRKFDFSQLGFHLEVFYCSKDR